MNRHVRLSAVAILTCLLLATALAPLASAQSPCGSVVTVTFRDTLTAIANRCGTTVEAILQANPSITNPNQVRVGQQLVMPGAAQPQTAPAPVVAIFPVGGPPNSNITVIVNGFPPNSAIVISLGRAGLAPAASQQITIGPQGAYQTVVTVPSVALPGEQWHVTVRTADNAFLVTSYPFVVSASAAAPTPVPAPATATPSGTLFTSANNYLVAIGDAGLSGPLIGCDDSIVAVQVQFPPTVAPLRAAIENLLSIDSQFYGQSGLYNALWQSDLAVEGVNIVNGEAIINLTGTLIQGGECDSPRIEAQLTQTALQFPTVTSVRININGQPLDQVLYGGNSVG